MKARRTPAEAGAEKAPAPAAGAKPELPVGEHKIEAKPPAPPKEEPPAKPVLEAAKTEIKKLKPPPVPVAAKKLPLVVPKPAPEAAALAPKEAAAPKERAAPKEAAAPKPESAPPPSTAEAAAAASEAAPAASGGGEAPKPEPAPPAARAAHGAPRTEKPGAGGEAGPAPARKRARAAGGGAAAEGGGGGGDSVAQYLLARGASALRRAAGLVGRLRTHEKTHDDAAQKRQQAEQAVVIPPSEGQSKSNRAQVGAVDARPAPAVDKGQALTALHDSLKANIPKTIEDVDNFKRDKRAEHTGADVMQVVSGDTNAVTSTYADMETTPPPAPPERAPEALPPMEAAPATPGMDLGRGAIAPLQPEHTDVSGYVDQADAKLAQEGVTQEQLDMVDSGDLAQANREKKGMEKAAKTEPLAVQKFAQHEAARTDGDLKRDEKTQRGALTAKRRNELGATGRKQKSAKSTLEKKRDEVAARINGIFKAAQDKVKNKLAELETQSMKRFDDGNAKATRDFEDNVKREFDAYKKDRYSGWTGWAKRGKDWLLGMDDLPGVKAIFERNRAAFVTSIDKLVADIGADNKRVIKECKDELEKAKTDIKDYVDKLGPALKDIGKRAAEEMNGKLAELDKYVDRKAQELRQQLADKQRGAIKAIDEKIAKMKEAMSGALAKLGKLLLLAAKKFFAWALEKFGYSLGTIEGIINKGVAVLKAIFTRPLAFVKNLMRAAITGFENFGKHFLTHLKDALFEWLTGSLQGITLPKTWDFKGVVGVVLQMIGISYQNIRRHMVAVMGEPVVVGLEKSFALVKTLVTEGPMAAWEQLKEMAGEMRDAFIDAVKDFIKQKIVEQAIQWVISTFVPGAGIVKAIIGIYDTVVFFIQKAKQIAKMVGSFLGSIAEIAAGNIGAAAEALESGLARALSLVINFLAQLLHLGGITDKIRNAIQKIRGKVDNVISKVANWIADKAKKLFGAVKAGAKAGVKGLLQWWHKKIPFQAGGESHVLQFQGERDAAVLVVRSTPKSPEDFIHDFVATGASTKETKQVAALTKEINDLKKKVAAAQKKDPPNEAAIQSLDADLSKKFNALGEVLATLVNKAEDEGSEQHPLPIAYPKRRAAAYPNIYVGSRTEQTVEQDWLRAAAQLSGAKAKAQLSAQEPKLKKEADFVGWSGGIKVYRAAGGTGQKLPDDDTVGLDPAFANLAPGKVLVYEDKGRTGGGGKINKLFRPYGFRPSVEHMDGDHVMERQLGGPDIISNLWPLPAGENRSSGSTVNSMQVTFQGKQMTVHEARQKRKKRSLYLLIKSVRTS